MRDIAVGNVMHVVCTLTGGWAIWWQARWWWPRIRRRCTVSVVRSGVLEVAAMIPPKFRVDRGLGLALASYVQQPWVSWGRREEIARRLEHPLRGAFRCRRASATICCYVRYHRAFIAEQAQDEAVGVPAGRDVRVY